MVEEGHLDSQGRFTMDGQQAWSKLKDRLLQPEDCLLYLLQSAVASGAGEMRVQAWHDELVVEHDGFFPRVEDAAEVLGWALESSQERSKVARQRLGLALASTLTLPGQGLRLEYPNGQAVVWRPSRGVSMSLTEGPPGHQRIRLPVKQPWWKRLFGTSGSAPLRRLRQCGRFAPLLLTVGHSAISGAEFGKTLHGTSWAIWSDTTTKMNGGEDSPIYYSDHHPAEMRFACDSGSPDRLGLPPSSLASHTLVPPGGEPGKAWSAAVAWRMNRKPARVEVVQYGVSLLPVQYPSLPAALWVLLGDSTLPTDLTCLRPVMGQELDKRVESLAGPFLEAFAPLQELHSKSAYPTDPLEVWLVNTRSAALRGPNFPTR